MTDAMVTRIDELRRPAGALLLWQPLHNEYKQRLLKGAHLHDEAERLFAAIRGDVERILYAEGRPALHRAIQETMSGYLMRKGELFALFLESVPDHGLEAFWEAYAEARETARDLIRTEAATYLDRDTIDRFRHAVDGALDYSETILRVILSEGGQVVDADAVDGTLAGFVRADLLLMTAFLLIHHEVGLDLSTEDAAQILALIADEAAQAMDRIEETLLEADPDLQRRLGETGETDVPLADYRQSRGLA